MAMNLATKQSSMLNSVVSSTDDNVTSKRRSFFSTRPQVPQEISRYTQHLSRRPFAPPPPMADGSPSAPIEPCLPHLGVHPRPHFASPNRSGVISDAAVTTDDIDRNIDFDGPIGDEEDLHGELLSLLPARLPSSGGVISGCTNRSNQTFEPSKTQHESFSQNCLHSSLLRASNSHPEPLLAVSGPVEPDMRNEPKGKTSDDDDRGVMSRDQDVDGSMLPFASDLTCIFDQDPQEHELGDVQQSSIAVGTPRRTHDQTLPTPISAESDDNGASSCGAASVSQGEDSTDAETSSDDDKASTNNDVDGEVNNRVNSNPRDCHSKQWHLRYKDLVAYRAQHGDCLVPYNYTPNGKLAQWVKRQRYQGTLKYSGRTSTLTAEREHLLNSIGFVWDSQRTAWEEKLEELLNYKSVFGHCNVPTRYAANRSLAAWVKCQRRQRKLQKQGQSTSLTEERRQMLDDVGFVWSPKRSS